MTPFEQAWHAKYMNNMVTLDTINRLVAANKLSRETVDSWVQERIEKYGY